VRINSRKIISKLEKNFPIHLAESWDNVGFQIGNQDRVIDKILCCLEVTDEVIDEAIEKCADLIIAHHPLIFKGVKTLSEDNAKSKLITRLIKSDINLYVMHTNFDQVSGGVNDILSTDMELERVEALKVIYSEPLIKLQVYVPQESCKGVEEAIYAQGAGHIGRYSGCGYKASGKGTFTPLEGSNPTLGQIGISEEVDEVKLETIVMKKDLNRVLKAMIAAHPYEEVAYDLIALMNQGPSESLGRVGFLPKVMTAEEFAHYLKVKLKLDSVKVCSSSNKKISKVALVSGAGMDFVYDAIKHKADAFVTGDIKYHEAQEAKHSKIAMFDIGHFESEVIFSKGIAQILESIKEEQNYDVMIDVSEKEAPIFKVY